MSEWVSVHDGLPEPFVDVLAYCKSSAGQAIAEDELYFAIDRFCIWNDGHLPSFRTTRFFGDVIAWMPLPKPPEEQ